MKFCELLIKEDQGFTLSEIMVTIILLGVLLAMALPSFTTTVERSKSGEGVQTLTAILAAQKLYQFETGDLSTNTIELEINLDELAGSLKHFDAPTLPGLESQVASIERTGGDYTFDIDINGVVSCTAGVEQPTICSNMGF